MKYTKVLLLLLTITILGLVTTRSAYAVACSAQVGTTVTVSSSCTFANNADGVDSGGSGTGNTGVITITSGATLTVGAGQTIAYGSITKGAGGGSIIKTGGGVLLKAGIWYTDADADGYPSSTTAVVQTTQPANGRRKNVMTSVSSADCNDADNTKYQNLTGYGGSDADGDTYYNGSSTSVCSGASLPSGYSSSQDCYDSDANVKPGQTTLFSTPYNGSSYDYNCDGSTTKILSKQGNVGCTDAGSGYCGPDSFMDANYSCGGSPSVSGGACNGFRGTLCCR